MFEINMQFFLGWVLIIFPGILFIAQVISSINFNLAQKLGLQENPAEADSILQTAKKYVAYWDLLTLVWMPVSGVLMVIDNSAWSIVAFFAGAIYIDTSGRESAKFLSFKHEGIRIGPPNQQKFFFGTYIIMAILGVTIVVYSLNHLIQISTFE